MEKKQKFVLLLKQNYSLINIIFLYIHKFYFNLEIFNYLIIIKYIKNEIARALIHLKKFNKY